MRSKNSALSTTSTPAKAPIRPRSGSPWSLQIAGAVEERVSAKLLIDETRM